MNTTMKTTNDFSARSAKGLGGANGSADVPTAAGSADVPVRIVAGLTPAFCRAAMTLLAVMLTTATAWADGDVVEVSQVNSRKRYYDDTWSILLHAKF